MQNMYKYLDFYKKVSKLSQIDEEVFNFEGSVVYRSQAAW